MGPLFCCAALLLLSCLSRSTAQKPLTSHVDTRIGTGGFGFGVGNVNPGAQVPFGCMRLGPDTSAGIEPLRITFNSNGGYSYLDTFIDCFSHTHLVGAGLFNFENFGFIVTRKFNNNTIIMQNYRSKYSHSAEVAVPGYYAVELQTWNTHAEVAVSGTHSGMHRYLCRNASAASPCHLLLDICHSPGIITFGDDCSLAQLSNLTLSEDGTVVIDAMVLNKGHLAGQGFHIYLHAIVSATTVNGTTARMTPQMWMDNAILSKVDFAPTTSRSLGIGLTALGDSGSVVFTVRVGLSFVSQANAINNLMQQQQPQRRWLDLEEMAESTRMQWEAVLQRISVQGGFDDAGNLTTFYSAMYRAHMVPSTYSEANGEYLGLDNKVHVVPAGHAYLSDLSLWDSYRTQMPLMVFSAPEMSSDLVRSMLLMFAQGGELPQWVLANNEAHCMVGHHSAVVFADAAMKGVGGFDSNAVLEALVRGLAEQNRRLDKYGYVIYEDDIAGACKTLDYAVDAGSAYNLAKHLGNSTAAALMYPVSQAYRNVWEANTSFVLPRYRNGSFASVCIFNIYPLEKHYVEGNAYQYRYYVPHDLYSLVGLFSSLDVFAQQLSDFFFMSEYWIFNNTLPNWTFWAGNEIDLQVPFLFNYAGNQYAYLTSKWLSRLLPTYYYPYPAGVPGNEDYGTMAAWCVFAYLGLYPMASTDQYAVFTPSFDNVRIRVSINGSRVSPWKDNVGDNGTVITLKAYNRSRTGPSYIQLLKINGRVMPTTVITHKQLLSDASHGPTLLEFFLTGEPVVYGQPTPSQGGPMPFVPRNLPKQIAEERLKELSPEIEKLIKATKQNRRNW